MSSYFSNHFNSSFGRRPTYGRGFNGGRLIIGAIIAIFSLISYFGSKEYNPVTGEEQYISLSKHQEIALGLQAVPEMMNEFGGPSQNREGQALVSQVGEKLVQQSKAKETDWQFEFHLLDDDQTINAFALPGGQVFITEALFDRLNTEGQLAGVLGHEIGHVVARHGAQHLAKQNLTQGLTGAVMAASGDVDTARLAMFIGQMVNMKYGREDELQSDQLGVLFLSESGYDPRAMIKVMEVLAEAGGRGGQPEFFSTHPNPDNRIQRIEDAIEATFPDGVPSGLIP